MTYTDWYLAYLIIYIAVLMSKLVSVYNTTTTPTNSCSQDGKRPKCDADNHYGLIYTA